MATRDQLENTDPDSAAMNAALDQAVRQRASFLSFGDVLAGEGTTTVSVDQDGHLLRHLPDGSVAPDG